MSAASKLRQNSLEEGTIFHDSKGRWVVMVSCGWTPRGTRKRVRRVRRTEREALQELKLHLFSGRLPDDERLTLGAWMDRWLSDHWHGSDRTRAFYSGLIAHWIRPTLGSRLLSRLTPGEIEALTKRGRVSLDGSGLHWEFTSPSGRRSTMPSGLDFLRTIPSEEPSLPRCQQGGKSFLDLMSSRGWLHGVP